MTDTSAEPATAIRPHSNTLQGFTLLQYALAATVQAPYEIDIFSRLRNFTPSVQRQTEAMARPKN
jgi:hypothetical protein